MARQITSQEFLRGRDRTAANEYNSTIEHNMYKTIQVIDSFLVNYKGNITVASGWRDIQSNRAAGGASNSCHLTGEACDLQDTTGELWRYVLDNLELAKQLGLFFEDRRWTTTWVHFQTRAPKSGRRIYVPNTQPAKDVRLWDGFYDKKYDLVLN